LNGTTLSFAVLEDTRGVEAKHAIGRLREVSQYAIELFVMARRHRWTTRSG
jgi:hypothetical protein